MGGKETDQVFVGDQLPKGLYVVKVLNGKNALSVNVMFKKIILNVFISGPYSQEALFYRVELRQRLKNNKLKIL